MEIADCLASPDGEAVLRLFDRATDAGGIDGLAPEPMRFATQKSFKNY